MWACPPEHLSSCGSCDFAEFKTCVEGLRPEMGFDDVLDIFEEGIEFATEEMDNEDTNSLTSSAFVHVGQKHVLIALPPLPFVQVGGIAERSTAQRSTAQHSTAQHSTAQHSAAQHSAAQRSTAQHSCGPQAVLCYAPGRRASQGRMRHSRRQQESVALRR